MHIVRPVGAVAALLACATAIATPTPITTTYTFDNGPSSSTNYNPYSDSNGPTSYTGIQGTTNWTTSVANGTYFGNALTFSATSGATPSNSTVQISAYAGTGAGNGTNGLGGTTGTIQNAIVTQYQTGTGQHSLAITSRDNGNTSTSNYEFACNGTTASTSSCSANANAPSYEHAIDNTGAFETLMLRFNSAVTLGSLAIGFPGAGSSNSGSTNATLLYYKGTDDPTAAILGKTYAQLVSSGSWGYTNVMGIAGSSCGSVTDCATVATTAASQYWMIGAFINTIDRNASLGDSGTDYFKIRSVTTTAVPEPGTLVLMGVAGVALLGSRRRRGQPR